MFYTIHKSYRSRYTYIQLKYLFCGLILTLIEASSKSSLTELNQLLQYVTEKFSEILLPAEVVTRLEFIGKGIKFYIDEYFCYPYTVGIASILIELGTLACMLIHYQTFPPQVNQVGEKI